MGFDSESGSASCDEPDASMNQTVPENESSLKRSSYLCPFDGCGKCFNRPKRLKTHIALHNGERPYKCTYQDCNKAYTVTQHLNRHIRNKHGPKSMYKQLFRCPHPDCMQELSNQHNLKRHYYHKHKMKSPYECTFCDMGFNKHSQLKKHLYFHTGIAPYRCTICDIGFTTLTDYNRHQRGHKDYVCTECDEVFKSWSHFRAHIRIKHPSEFVCDTCGRSFKGKSRLRIHMTIHQETSERETFPCPFPNCPRFYFQKRNLTHHIKSSHEGKKFECTYEDCGSVLSSKRCLDHHLKLHRTNRPTPRRKKKRNKRRDAGIPKRSMAVKLSGIQVPYEIEKIILNRNQNGLEKSNSVEKIHSHVTVGGCVVRNDSVNVIRNEKPCETITSEKIKESEKQCETITSQLIKSDSDYETVKNDSSSIIKDTNILDNSEQPYSLDQKESREKGGVKYKYQNCDRININSKTILSKSVLEKLEHAFIEFNKDRRFSNAIYDEISEMVQNVVVADSFPTTEVKMEPIPSSFQSSATENANDVEYANRNVSDSINMCNMSEKSDASLVDLEKSSVKPNDPSNKLILGVKVGNELCLFIPDTNDNCDGLLQELCDSRASEREKKIEIEDRNLSKNLSNHDSNELSEYCKSDNIERDCRKCVYPPDDPLQEKTQLLAGLEVNNEQFKNCRSYSKEANDNTSVLSDRDSLEERTQTFVSVERTNFSEMESIETRVSQKTIEKIKSSKLQDGSMHAPEVSTEFNTVPCKDEISVNVENIKSIRKHKKPQTLEDYEHMKSVNKRSVTVKKIVHRNIHRQNKSKICGNELQPAQGNEEQDSLNECIESENTNTGSQNVTLIGRRKQECKGIDSKYLHLSSSEDSAKTKSIVIGQSSSDRSYHEKSIQRTVSEKNKRKNVFKKNVLFQDCKKRKLKDSVQFLCSPLGNMNLFDENNCEESEQESLASSEVTLENVEKQLPCFLVCRDLTIISQHPVNTYESDTMNDKHFSEEFENIQESVTNKLMTENDENIRELLNSSKTYTQSVKIRKKQKSVDAVVQSLHKTLENKDLSSVAAISQTLVTTENRDYNSKSYLSLLNETKSNETSQDILNIMSSEKTLPKDINAELIQSTECNTLGKESLHSLTESCATFKKSMPEIEKPKIVTCRISKKLRTLMSIVSDSDAKTFSTQRQGEKTDNPTTLGLSSSALNRISFNAEKEDNIEEHKILKKNYYGHSDQGNLQGMKMNLPITKWLELMQRTMEPFVQL